MPRIITELDVWIDGYGPDPVRVVTDQRDIARWEVQPFRDESRHNLRARYVAWSALVRSGAYAGTWQAFNDIDAISVENVEAPDPNPEDEQGLDPGHRPTSATA